MYFECHLPQTSRMINCLNVILAMQQKGSKFSVMLGYLGQESWFGFALGLSRLEVEGHLFLFSYCILVLFCMFQEIIFYRYMLFFVVVVVL